MKKTSFVLSLLLFSHFSSGISFDDALNSIITRSPRIKAQKAKLASQKHNYYSSFADFLPNLNIGFTKNKSFEFDTNPKQYYLSSSVNLFKGGSDIYNFRSNRLLYNSEKDNSKQLFLDVENEASLALINYIESKTALDIIKDQVKLTAKSHKIAKTRYKKGLLPQEEVDKSFIDLQNTNAKLMNQEILSNSAKSKVMALLGETDFRFKYPWRILFLKMDLKKIEKLKFDINKRPDYRKAKFDFKSSQFEVTREKLKFLPTIDLSYQMTRASLDNSNQFDDRTALLTFNIPIWDGYSNLKSLYQNKYNEAYSRSLMTQLQRDISANWPKQKENLTKAISTLKIRVKTLELSERVYQSNFKRFRLGKVRVNELQVDQNRFLESKNLVNLGLAQAHKELIEICKAKGQRISTCLKDF